MVMTACIRAVLSVTFMVLMLVTVDPDTSDDKSKSQAFVDGVSLQHFRRRLDRR